MMSYGDISKQFNGFIHQLIFGAQPCRIGSGPTCSLWPMLASASLWRLWSNRSVQRTFESSKLDGDRRLCQALSKPPSKSSPEKCLSDGLGGYPRKNPMLYEWQISSFRLGTWHNMTISGVPADRVIVRGSAVEDWWTMQMLQVACRMCRYWWMVGGWLVDVSRPTSPKDLNLRHARAVVKTSGTACESIAQVILNPETLKSHFHKPQTQTLNLKNKRKSPKLLNLKTPHA